MLESKGPSTGNAIYTFFSGCIRLLVLGYTALAVFTFFEVRALLRHSKNSNSFQIDDGTLYIPLVLCFPSELKVDGRVILDSTNMTSPAFVQQAECRQLDYLISACASSLLLSGAACVLFVFCDCLARFRCCPFDGTSSSGMAIFLIFLLAQSGVSVGALAEQNHYWVQYFKEVVEDRDIDLDVESYAHSIFLIGSAFSAFGIAFLVLIDAIFSCCCPNRAANIGRRDEEEQEKQERGSMRWIHRTKNSDDSGERGTNSPHVPDLHKNDAESSVAPSSDNSSAIIPPWWKA